MNLFQNLTNKNNIKYLFEGAFGFEKENLRVTKEGKISSKNHPETLGCKDKNPYITTDFAESQIEIITPPLTSIDESYNFLTNLHDIVTLNIGDELLWTGSMPPEDVEGVTPARFKESEKTEYREWLLKRYGIEKMLISGLHFNVSFSKKLLTNLRKLSETDLDEKGFRNEVYLKVMRNFLKYRWFLNYVNGSSPLDRSQDEIEATTLRNGSKGYNNLIDIHPNLDSLDGFIGDLKDYIKKEHLESEKEFYSSLRLKAKDNNSYFESLEEDGIEYIEVRNVDLNPLTDIGVEKETFKFIHLYLIYCLLKDEEREFSYEEATANSILVAEKGRSKNLNLYRNGEELPFDFAVREILDDLKEVASQNEEYSRVIKEIEEKIETKTLPSYLIEKEIKKRGYREFHLEQGKLARENSLKRRFNLIGYENLELSTQILLKEAITRGLKWELVDESENFITLANEEKKEYIVQATKTSLDSYSTILVMENKIVTKKVLEENDVRVPKGANYRDFDEALEDYDIHKGNKLVIKPKSTNFGLGITIFKEKFSKEDYKKALEIAFSHDSDILVEEFISGREYRFLVMGDEVVGILRRVPANVQGDGEKSISGLITHKNRDPLRGRGYKTPLEKIREGEEEALFLKGQGLDFNYVPKLGEKVYLRENSNISTGGDSVDYTDDIHFSYKEVAVKASKSAGAKICGVDMMIDDIKKEADEDNHAIIELNFNPAIHIHTYPYKGKNRKPAKKILDMLGF